MTATTGGGKNFERNTNPVGSLPVLNMQEAAIGDTAPTFANWLQSDYWNNKKICNLSLPGTHDSGTYNYGKVWKPVASCQNKSIKEQLNFGVRYLYLTLGVEDNRLVFWHGIAGQANLTFRQAIDQILSFLRENDTEFVICHMKYEHGERDNIRDRIIQELAKYVPADKLFAEQKMPYVKEVRGKMVIWNDNMTDNGFGLKVWLQGDVHTRELYTFQGACIGKAMTENTHESVEPDKKINLVENHLLKASQTSDTGAGCHGKSFNLYITYTSMHHNYGILTPLYYSQKINPEVIRWICALYTTHRPNIFGIVAGDFVDSVYSGSIIYSNWP